MSSVSRRLALPPSAIRLFPDRVVVSTYQLIDANTRVGELLLLSSRDLSPLHSIACSSGIFRFQSLPSEDGHRFLAALCNGRLALISSTSCVETAVFSDGMLLSVDAMNAQDGLVVVCGDTLGCVHLFDMVQQQISTSFLAHTLPFTGQPCEVWCSASLDAHCVISGGDDGLFKQWDLRTLQDPVTVSKEHGSGVVCIYSSDDYLLTGSYDQHLRRWDRRQLRRSISSVELAGGVWSIERHTKPARSWLTACMYGGWCLLDDDFHMISSFSEGNLLYGASLAIDGHLRIASATFNDSTVRIDPLAMDPILLP